MIVSVQTGVSPDVWLDHPRALLTAAEVLDEIAAARNR